METVYQKRLHRIIDMALQDGAASERFKSISSLIECWEWHDTKRAPVDDRAEKPLEEPVAAEKPVSDPPSGKNHTHLDATSSASVSPASSSMRSPAVTPPPNELPLSQKLELIAKNRLAALAKREQKAKEAAELLAQQCPVDLSLVENPRKKQCTEERF